MLIPTMTPEEIYAEMYKDAAWLENEINNKLTPAFQKLAKRASRFPFCELYGRTSKKTRIQYFVAYDICRKAEWKAPHVTIFTMYTHEYGRNLIYIDQDFNIRIYTPHFIGRYKERNPEEYKNIPEGTAQFADMRFIARNWDIEEMKLTKEFEECFKENKKANAYFEKIKQSRFWSDPDLYEQYCVACESGICLCERVKANPKISIFRTFISLDMFNGLQGYDYVAAYSHIFLRAMSREYPNQIETWGKEWEDVHKLDLEPTDQLDAFAKLMDDLRKRYPPRI